MNKPGRKSKRRGITNVQAFIVGAMVGLIVFTAIYGLAIVNPTYTDWIWHGVMHDTAQHFIGWEFYRAGSDGATITGLAHPYGLAATFMDVIPLLAFAFKPFAAILPASFQYFGLWGLVCYLLMGGLAAVLIRRIWLKLFSTNTKENQTCCSSVAMVSNGWQILFIIAGAIIFTLSPMLMARSFYHPALAAQWLILLGILLILDARKFTHWWAFAGVWSLVLVMAVLIHPYFVPMLGAMMLIAAIRSWQFTYHRSTMRRIINLGLRAAIPVIVTGLVFYLIGGFSLGTGSEVHDIEEKGFNLLSFINPGGYSIIPAFPNKSTSPETLMWLGLGVIIMLAAAAVMLRGRYRQSLHSLSSLYKSHLGINVALTIIGLALLIFAMGPRIDLGPITLLHYSVPDKIYELWSAFRAAAREAWPFYYATVLLIIYWFTLGLSIRLKLRGTRPVKTMMLAAIILSVVAIIQLGDSWFSKNSIAKREGFKTATTTAPEFNAINIDGIYNGQKNLVALDESFRGDQSGTYQQARTALGYNLTLNSGFFARLPARIKSDQATTRDQIQSCQLPSSALADDIYFTRDSEFADTASQCYTVQQRAAFYYIYK